MDILIPIADRTAANFFELRHSLRSIEKHLKGFDRIFLIGKLPNFIDGDSIYHLSFRDNFGFCKERRIMEKIKFACVNSDISDDFIFMNDDYFFMKDLDVKDIRPRYSNRLVDKIPGRRVFDDYAISMVNTLCALIKNGFKDLYFDIHYPIVYNKEKFLEVMELYDWDVRLGFVIKSLYANSLKLEGEIKEDLKISSVQVKFDQQIKKIEDIFSTNDILPYFVKELITKNFPFPSQYEKKN